MLHKAKHDTMMKHVRLHFLLTLFSILLLPYALRAAGSGENRALRTVVIDAGHGGHDPGAVSAGVREKDIVLDIALRLGKKINQAYPEVKVIYTRDKDVFIPLFQRADVANRNKADLFISLHANYVSSPSASGTETFTLGLHRSQENLEVAKKENSVILLEDDYSSNYEGFDPREAESYIMFENLQSEYQGQSIDFAAQIQRQFGQNLSLIDRGVKQAGFLVLRRVAMPGVLVEVGFISNPNERKFLVSETGKEKVTESIFKAFSSYKKSIDDRSRFNIAQTDNSVSGTVNESQVNTPPVVAPGPSASDTSPNSDNRRNENSAKVQTPANEQQWYAVQVAAVQKVIQTNPSNFKGENNITRLPVGNINKYVAGRFKSYSEAAKERDRLKSKFPDSFVVIVNNGIPTLVKN